MKILFTLLTLLFLSACATKPIAYDSKKSQGQWEAKAQVKDFKKDQTHNVTLDVIGSTPHQVRMEVSATLGVSLASLVIDGDQIAYAIHPQKKYFSGEVSDQALKPLFQIELNPKYLMNVFFDQPIREKSWSCTMGVDQLVEKCERLSDGLSIDWRERKGELKRVVIKSSDFEVQVLVKDFTTKVELSTKTFSLEIPQGYKAYKFRQ